MPVNWSSRGSITHETPLNINQPLQFDTSILVELFHIFINLDLRPRVYVGQSFQIPFSQINSQVDFIVLAQMFPFSQPKKSSEENGPPDAFVSHASLEPTPRCLRCLKLGDFLRYKIGNRGYNTYTPRENERLGTWKYNLGKGETSIEAPIIGFHGSFRGCEWSYGPLLISGRGSSCGCEQIIS